MSQWIFELANSSDLSKIGELTQARNRSLTLTLNRAGSASFSIPLDDSLGALIEEVSTCLIIRRKFSDGLFRPVWSGYVSGISEQTPNQMSVNCTGWLQTLEKRFIKADKFFNDIDAGEIALTTLDTINTESGSLPVYVNRGALITSITRIRNYKAYESALKIIQDLSDIENGYDLDVTPDTRLLNIYSKKQTIRSNFTFSYGLNISDLTRTSDTSRIVNRIIVFGNSGLSAAQADDFTSQAQYGLIEEVVTLADVNDQLILAAYANAEIAIRSQPLKIYTFSLRKTTPSLPDPKIFIDYEIGDQILITARHGRIQEGNKPVRIFSVSLNISENGDEQISNIQTTANV